MRRSLAALALLLAAGCAEPPGGPPPLALLSAREILALSPRALAKISPADRASLRARLDQAMVGQAAEPASHPRDPGAVPAAPVVAMAQPAPVRLALALDLDRREAGNKPLLAASLEGADLRPLPLASLYLARGSGKDAFDFTLELAPGHALSLSAEALESLGEALSAIAVKGESITVEIAPSAPFGLLYARDEHRAYLNPIVLELRDTAQDRSFAEHEVDSHIWTRVCSNSGAEARCLEDALTLRTVERCVSRLDPRCLPTPGGLPLAALIAATPTCGFTIQACLVEPIVDSPCAIAGPCGTPCSISGAQSGSACGRGAGQACGATCTACGITASCDRVCMDLCREPCGTRCASGCEQQGADCGADCGSGATRSCTKSCGEAGTSHGGVLTEAVDEVHHPLPPPPPLDARRPPPLRAIAVTGARDGLAFVLPPVIFFWIRRRLARGRPAPPPRAGRSA